jgi:hypothetical protein
MPACPALSGPTRPGTGGRDRLPASRQGAGREALCALRQLAAVRVTTETLRTTFFEDKRPSAFRARSPLKDQT